MADGFNEELFYTTVIVYFVFFYRLCFYEHFSSQTFRGKKLNILRLQLITAYKKSANVLDGQLQIRRLMHDENVCKEMIAF